MSYLHKKYPKLDIYSFDINMENNALSTIKDIYGIRQVPSLIINDEVYPGFISKEEIESVLKAI